MNKRTKLIIEINEFLLDTIDALIDHVRKDAKYTGDVELSEIIDLVSYKKYPISFEDIVKCTVKRIRTAIYTFINDTEGKK